MQSPELCWNLKNDLQKITRIEASLSQRVFFEFFQSKGNKKEQADLLADHDSQVAGLKILKWHVSQSMTCPHKMRITIRLSPVIVFQLLKILSTVEIGFHTSLSNHFHQHSLGPATIKLTIENLFPRTEIEIPIGNGHNNLAPHDLAFHMGICIVFAGTIVSVLLR